MWVFCRRGFFSAVEHRERKENVLIRGRFPGDLEKLAAEFGLPPKSVRFTPRADYAWRLELPKKQWAEFLAKEAQAIDYDNFKDSVHGETRERDLAYMGCWSALRKAQQDLVPFWRRPRD